MMDGEGGEERWTVSKRSDGPRRSSGGFLEIRAKVLGCCVVFYDEELRRLALTDRWLLASLVSVFTQSKTKT